MNISNNNMMQEMQSMLAELRPETMRPEGVQIQRIEQNQTQTDFGAMLKGAIDNINNLQSEARDLVTRVEMGDRSVSLAEAMIASQKSSIAFEAGVQVRNKVVEAYEKIMNMPV